jgi:hypothetical protein
VILAEDLTREVLLRVVQRHEKTPLDVGRGSTNVTRQMAG